jgi:hypothetical protein
VGHIMAAICKPGLPLLSRWFGPPCVAIVLSGVGNNPNSLTLVWRSHIFRAQHSPFRIVPQRGQITEDSPEPAKSEHWGVFHEDFSRSYLANNPGHVPPKAASFASDPGTFPGCADVLAGKPSRNHVNNSPPRSAVKGANVIPNREGREKSVILSGAQYACGIGVALDSANRAPSEQLPAKYSATSACE